jgi:hypothetical protein
VPCGCGLVRLRVPGRFSVPGDGVARHPSEPHENAGHRETPISPEPVRPFAIAGAVVTGVGARVVSLDGSVFQQPRHSDGSNPEPDVSDAGSGIGRSSYGLEYGWKVMDPPNRGHRPPSTHRESSIQTASLLSRPSESGWCPHVFGCSPKSVYPVTCSPLSWPNSALHDIQSISCRPERGMEYGCGLAAHPRVASSLE